MSYTDFEVAAMSGTQIAALSIAQINTLRPEQLASLTLAQMGALTALQLSALASLNALTAEQFSALTASQISSLSAAQIRGLEMADFRALSNLQVAAISTAGIAALTSEQLKDVNYSALTVQQISALTTSEIVAIGAAPVPSVAWTLNPDIGTYIGAADALVTGLDGSIYVAGDFRDDSGKAYLSKFSPEGQLDWTQSLGTSGAAGGIGAMVVASYGLIHVGGGTAGGLNGQPDGGVEDAFVTAFNSDGSQVQHDQGRQNWSLVLGSTGSDAVTALTEGVKGVGLCRG